jgi:TetR/AcrR family acrAB operon transcriptional repressor
MVRQTKENAEITRQRIIDAAREVFLSRGVSRTSMEQIASHAELTRGAIYWHFSNKTELFSALREQVLLPLFDRMDESLLNENDEDPLGQISKFLMGTIEALNDCLQTRQTFEIMMVKCEYVEDLAKVLEQTLCNCEHIAQKIEQLYTRAQSKGQLKLSDSPAILAMDTHLFFSGLMHLWVKDLDQKYYRNVAADLITKHINLRRK